MVRAAYVDVNVWRVSGGWHQRAAPRTYSINLVDTVRYHRIIIGLVWRYPSNRRLITQAIQSSRAVHGRALLEALRL
jgi:hypothetical protein